MSDGLELMNASEVRGAFIAKGAVGPANAQPGKYLGVDTPAFKNLLVHGVIREGPPGSFYLYEADIGPLRNRLLKKALFWIFIILLPVLIIQYTGR